jgi:hypothetical protein
MKKLVLISTLVAVLAGTSAFGQGYMTFSQSKSAVWDAFTAGPASSRTSNVEVAFLWAAGASVVPSVASILASTPTNGVASIGANAWTSILSDPNFHLGVNNNTSALMTAVVQNANGVFAYGGAAPIQGSALGTYTLFVIGWSSAYATPALAAAGNSPVGWSVTQNYNFVDQLTIPTTMTLTPFGVVPIPEPATMALAGLGGLMLLAIRRRK